MVFKLVSKSSACFLIVYFLNFFYCNKKPKFCSCTSYPNRDTQKTPLARYNWCCVCEFSYCSKAKCKAASFSESHCALN